MTELYIFTDLREELLESTCKCDYFLSCDFGLGNLAQLDEIQFEF